MMRGGLVSMLYNKATNVPLSDVDAASSITLMSADVERIVTGMETGHEVRKSISLFMRLLQPKSMSQKICFEPTTSKLSLQRK